MNNGARNNLFAWLQLLRLPNVFTAVADVTMGYVVTHGGLQPAHHFLLLAAASCLLYLSGMVLNDVFDAEVDAHDRPERPIPSGKVALRTATGVGWAMLASGVLVACFASFVAGDWRPASIAIPLAACILLYDGALKRTPLAPLLMGVCRAFNVLLGMGLADDRVSGLSRDVGFIVWGRHAAWLIAFGIGVYIVGVTWFARTEARTSSRLQLTGGTIVSLVGMALLASVPSWEDSNLTPLLRVSLNGWYLLWAALALITARRCILAIVNPTPNRVQTAVRHMVQSIIVLDAAVCVGYAGPFWGLAMLSLIVPTLVMALWLKAT